MLTKLHHKYFILIFIVLTLHILVISIFNYNYLHKRIEVNYIELTSKSVIQKSESMLNYFEVIERSSEKLANDIKMNKLLASDAYSSELMELLSTFKLTTPGITLIKMVRSHGYVYTTSGRTQSYGQQLLADFSIDTQSKWTLKESTLEPIQNTLTYVKVVEDANANINQLRIEIDAAYLGKIMKTDLTSWSGMLLPDKSLMIPLYFASDLSQEDYIKFASIHAPVISEHLNLSTYRLKKNYIHLYHYKDLPFELIYVVPTKAVENKIEHLKISLSVIGLVMILVSSLFSLLISFLILMPLKKILNRFYSEYDLESFSRK